MSLVIGIDPGASGAIVVLDKSGKYMGGVQMPTVKVGKSTRVNGAAVASFLRVHDIVGAHAGERPEWSNWPAYLNDIVEEMDNAVRKIEARGVEKLAERWRTAEKLAKDDGEFRAAHGLAFDAARAEKFASELREASND